jgi:hypothetical protein
MSELAKYKDLLLFEYQKEFWNERGKGARYRLTRAGVKYFEDQMGEDIKDVEKIKDWLIKNKFAEDIETQEDQLSFSIKVKGCCMKNIKEKFDKDNLQPLSCPIANVFMYAFELNSGLAPELLPIENEGDACKTTMAKMATSEVVEG